MPQWTGQLGSTRRQAPLQPEWISPAKLVIINTVNQSLVEKASGGFRAGDELAEIRLLSDISGWLPVIPFQPLLSTGAGKPRAQTSKESHLCQPENHLTSERETLSEGWFFLQEEKNQLHILYITLYVIVYNLLIPWWWCPCMEYLVFGFLKTAWNKNV